MSKHIANPKEKKPTKAETGQGRFLRLRSVSIYYADTFGRTLMLPVSTARWRAVPSPWRRRLECGRLSGG